jgi:WD40 repeat protein
VEVPGYKVLGLLGKGGMGVVYKARQQALGREVALKMILAAEHAGAEQRQRFRREAQAVARLQHPNVVQVFEVGEHQGLPYFSMEFCPGGSLSEQLSGGPLAPAEAAALVEALARAVHAAHLAHVVHRDLKPGNVLFAADGTPKITDFGLAKRLDVPGHTQTGAVVGTPSYMAPEQAGGKTKEIGPAADVYALGALLYEVLTGRPPFRGTTSLDVLMQVLEQDPSPPRQLRPDVPRDLETICLHCLKKDPKKRYSTALDLAEDLRRFGRGEPIRARPAGRGERLFLWAARRPALAGVYALAVTAAVLCGLGAGAAWLWQRAEEARREAAGSRDAIAAEKEETEKALRQAEDARQATERALHDTEAARSETAQARDRLDAEKKQTESALRAAQQAREATERALRETEAARSETAQARDRLDAEKKQTERALKAEEAARQEAIRALYLRRISLAYAEWRDNEQGRAEQLLEECPPALRQWEWRYVRRLSRAYARVLDAHTAAVNAVAVNPAGTRFATASTDRTVRIWDARSGEQLQLLRGHVSKVNCVTFDPQGEWLASGDDAGNVRLWDARTGRGVGSLRASAGLPPGPDQRLSSLFPAATVLLLGEEPPPLPRTGQQRPRPHMPDGRRGVPHGKGGHAKERMKDAITALRFSPDGKQLAGCSSAGTLTLWDAASREKVWSLPVAASHRHGRVAQSPRGVLGLAFSPDGSQIAAAGRDGMIRLCDAATGKETARLRGHSEAVLCVAFRPDGKALASGSMDQSILLWDVTTAAKTLALDGHGAAVTEVVFSADGKQLLSSSEDRTLRLWDGETGRPLRTLKGHTGAVRSVRFTPEGDRVVSGSDDRTARVWELRSVYEPVALKGHTEGIGGIDFSPDGKLLASAADDNTVRVWEVVTSRARLLEGHAGPVNDVAFSPDGQWLASGSDDKNVKLWEVSSGKQACTLEGHTGPVNRVTFSRDGQRLASGSDDGTVKLWDVVRRKEVTSLSTSASPVQAVAFSPDGLYLAGGCGDGSVRLWDVPTGRSLLKFRGHGTAVNSLAFSPDGKLLASGGDDWEVRVWGLNSGVRKRESDLRLRGHAAGVLCVAFSPDGQRLVSGSASGDLRLWDVPTGQEALALKHHTKGVYAAAFSPDGQRLASGSADKTVLLWEAPVESVVPRRRPVVSPADGHDEMLSDDDEGADIGDVAPSVRHAGGRRKK